MLANANCLTQRRPRSAWISVTTIWTVESGRGNLSAGCAGCSARGRKLGEHSSETGGTDLESRWDSIFVADCSSVCILF